MRDRHETPPKTITHARRHASKMQMHIHKTGATTHKHKFTKFGIGIQGQ